MSQTTKKQFYTQQGWEGSKYQESKTLRLKEIAKKIKDEVKSAHPKAVLSVRTEFFSGGSAIRIQIKSVPFKIVKKAESADQVHFGMDWELTPEAKAFKDYVQGVANQWRYDDSDSMIDYFSTNFYCHPDFDYEQIHKELKELGIRV